MAGLPPSRWQAEGPAPPALAAGHDSGGANGAGPTSPAAPPAASAEAAYTAWRHVRRVARDEASVAGDLYDQLVNSARETQYSLQPSGVSV